MLKDPIARKEYERNRYLERAELVKARALESHKRNRESRCIAMRDRHAKLCSTPTGHVIVIAKLACNRARRNGVTYDEAIIEHLSANPPVNCPDCHCVIDYTIGRGTGPSARLQSPSIDRLVAGGPYTIDNVRIICAQCNGRKWTYPVGSWQNNYRKE